MKYPLLSTALLSSTLTLSSLTLPSAAAYAGQWTLGLGAIGMEEIYHGQDKNHTLFPVIAYETENFSISGEGAFYQFYGNENSPLSLYAGLGISGNSYDSDDATILEGMKTRHDGVDLGIGGEFDLGMASLSAAIAGDVSGHHDGFQMNLGLESNFPVNRYLIVAPSIEVEALSKDYVDYYFGVKDSEATAARSAYKGKDTVNTSASLGFIIPITEEWRIVNQLTYTWLGDGISDSPLIKRDNVFSGMIMTTYTF